MSPLLREFVDFFTPSRIAFFITFFISLNVFVATCNVALAISLERFPFGCYRGDIKNKNAQKQ
jgi:hypothetical protein